MEEKSLLLQFVGDTPLFRIVDFLVENKGIDVSKKDILDGAKISRATLFNYWGQLEKYSIVKVTRRFGRTKLFTLDTSNVLVKRIIDLEVALINTTMEKAQKNKEILVEN